MSNSRAIAVNFISALIGSFCGALFGSALKHQSDDTFTAISAATIFVLYITRLFFTRNHSGVSA